MCAAAIYLACRLGGASRGIDEVARAANTEKRLVNKASNVSVSDFGLDAFGPFGLRHDGVEDDSAWLGLVTEGLPCRARHKNVESEFQSYAIA